MKKGIIVLFVLFLMLVLWAYIRHMQQKEFFEVYPSIQERVITLYQDVLERLPTSSELVNNTRDITDNMLTWDGLRQQLIDKEEYAMNVKLQSNMLVPELSKMIADSRILREISNIYTYVLKKDIVSKLLLPMRDIYIILSYNPYALVAMLQDGKYKNFEQDLLLDEDLNKKITVDLFVKTFDQVTIMKEATVMAKDPKYRNIALLVQSQSTAAGGSSSILTVDEQQQLRAALVKVNDILSRVNSMKLTDEEISKKLSDLEAQQKAILGSQGAERHDGDMVLRPEYEWSVPQKRAPVCTVPGQPAIVQPLLSSSTELLLGTPICEAEQTQVGSIMPRFQYKEESRK